MVPAVASSVVAVHDALSSEIGRGVHPSVLGQLLPAGAVVFRDGRRQRP
jgi:hypothetical protein